MSQAYIPPWDRLGAARPLVLPQSKPKPKPKPNPSPEPEPEPEPVSVSAPGAVETDASAEPASLEPPTAAPRIVAEGGGVVAELHASPPDAHAHSATFSVPLPAAGETLVVTCGTATISVSSEGIRVAHGASPEHDDEMAQEEIA